MGRRALLFLVGLIVIVLLVIVFSGTLTRSTDIEAIAEQARAEVDDLKRRAEAGAAELKFIEDPAFIRQQAPVHGYGEKGEIIFKLRPDAPEPEPIVPIGPQKVAGAAKAPIDAWMELLFGA